MKMVINMGGGRVKDHETLKARAVVRELAQAVEDQVHDLLADGVVTSGKVQLLLVLSRYLVTSL
jgi:hypothetical protein